VPDEVRPRRRHHGRGTDHDQRSCQPRLTMPLHPVPVAVRQTRVCPPAHPTPPGLPRPPVPATLASADPAQDPTPRPNLARLPRRLAPVTRRDHPRTPVLLGPTPPQQIRQQTACPPVVHHLRNHDNRAINT
jgi:hypothetical protein